MSLRDLDSIRSRRIYTDDLPDSGRRRPAATGRHL